MKNYTLLIGTAALSGLVAVSAPVMAQGYGNDPAAGANMSTQGSANTNSVNSANRDLGQDRARERASESSRLNRTETARRSGAANPAYSADQNAPDHSQHDQAGSENSATPTPSQ